MTETEIDERLADPETWGYLTTVKGELFYIHKPSVQANARMIEQANYFAKWWVR